GVESDVDAEGEAEALGDLAGADRGAGAIAGADDDGGLEGVAAAVEAVDLDDLGVREGAQGGGGCDGEEVIGVVAGVGGGAVALAAFGVDVEVAVDGVDEERARPVVAAEGEGEGDPLGAEVVEGVRGLEDDGPAAALADADDVGAGAG